MPETDRSISTRIDFTDPHTFDDPWETYRALRDLDTLHYDATNDFYVGARHEDVFTLSRDPETYCNKFGVRPKIAGDMSIITLDGDEHVRTRRLINQGFTPRRVRELIPHVRDAVQRDHRPDGRARTRSTSSATSPSTCR